MILHQKGFSAAELIIAIFVLTIASAGFYQIAVLSLNISKENKNEMKAAYLAKEGIEAIRNIRDQVAWIDAADGKTGIGELDLDLNDTHYPIISANSWELTFIDPGLIDNRFSRKIVFEKLSRDPDTGDIEDVYNSVNDDENSRKITTIVSWQENGKDKEVTLISYLTNFNY
ncbi:prepilin-type N-terminal cleavage/methylation domain-containing protein [Candidatus Parcubacteria bacterium]|nr:prepilin-type N-terminal cleavage/methylation domain-containing protein [Candidatus Parcubacteria bacterium]